MYTVVTFTSMRVIVDKNSVNLLYVPGQGNDGSTFVSLFISVHTSM